MPWDFKGDPAFERNLARRSKVMTFQFRVWTRVFPWMKHPFLQYITGFWIGLIDEGPREMLTPRWGGITFGWLNDGIKPTVWHTVRTLTHDQTDPYVGIYTDGAPASLAEARERELVYASRKVRDAQ